MDIDPGTAAGTSEYKGQTYYFCSLVCKKSFDKDPEKYLNQEHKNEHPHSIVPRNYLNRSCEIQPAICSKSLINNETSGKISLLIQNSLSFG